MRLYGILSQISCLTRKATGDYTLLGPFVKGGHIINNSNITSNNVDHAQRYSDTGTNPPYNSKGAVHADRIDKTIISNNNFTTSSGSSILIINPHLIRCGFINVII